MSNKQISNIYNPSEYLKEMADQETGKDEREPYQLDLDFGVREMTEEEITTIVMAQQKQIAELQKKLDEVYEFVSQIWSAR